MPSAQPLPKARFRRAAPGRFIWPALFLLIAVLTGFSLPASGSVPTFYAGSGEFGYQDGSRLEADFRFPYGLTANKDNQIIVADSHNNRIRKIAGDQVTTVAGFSDSFDAFGFPAGGYVDGAAEKARFRNPRGIVVDSANTIYVADTGNHAIRKISGGRVSTFAGNGRPGYQDGTGNQARFNAPSGLAIDEHDNLYVSDTLNNVIRKITPQGLVSTLAGQAGPNGGYRDGPVGGARFNEPAGLALAGNGALYVLDSGNQLVRKIQDLQVSTLAGFRDLREEETDYAPGAYRDGAWAEARFNFPKGIDLAPNGVIFIADTWNHRVRALTPQGEAITIAGTGRAGRTAETSTSMLNGPVDLLYHDGVLYISDMWNNGLRALPLDPYNLPRLLTPAPAAERIRVWLDGELLPFPDAEPYIEQGRVILPLRALGEKLGGQVQWLPHEHKAIVKKGALEQAFAAPYLTIRENRSMIPLRYLAERMGFQVEWVEQERAVFLKSRDQ